MIKLLSSAAFSLLLLSSWHFSLAETNVPHLGTPSELLQEAQSGPKELLAVVLKMKDNVRELRDQKTFDEFFALLEPLKNLSEKQNLNMIYPGAVEELGKSMIMHGNRWLKVTADSEDKILSYQKWADLTAALQFQSQVVEEISKIKDPALFKSAYANLLVLEDWASQNFSDDLYLLPTYKNLISELSFNALLNIQPQNKSDWSFWMSGINNQNSAQDYIAYLNEKILNEDLKEEETQNWFELVEALGFQMQKIERLSGSVTNNYGVLSADLLSKAISNEYSIPQTSFKNIIGFLDASSVRSLAFRWTNPEKAFSDSYAKSLAPLSEVLFQKAKTMNLNQTAKEIEQFASTRLSAALITQDGLEGTYKLTGNGRTWYFTILRESEQRLIAALCDSKSVVCFSFFNIQYNLDENKFYASERVPDDDVYQNIPVVIGFDQDKIELELPYAYKVGTHLSGEKVESYDNYMASPDLHANPMDGYYVGKVSLSNGSHDAVLMINTMGEYSLGRLEFKNGYISINFGRGNDGNIGYLYLSSGINQKRSWHHLRLRQLDDETIEGVLISGGKGIISKVLFTKDYL